MIAESLSAEPVAAQDRVDIEDGRRNHSEHFATQGYFWQAADAYGRSVLGVNVTLRYIGYTGVGRKSLEGGCVDG